jgi:hypothetical protein
VKDQAPPITTRQLPALNALLREYHSKFAPATAEPTLTAQHKQLLTDFEREHATWKKDQVLIAEDFNILHTMRLTRKELCHSDILAWLLDYRLEVFGTHAQGKSGFRLFLQRLGLPLHYTKADYRVFREAPGEESRLDILIEAERQFVIGIENKVDAEEGEDQTRREWADLVRRGKKQSVLPSRVDAFFLTPDELEPESRRFKAISWRLVADVFEAFAQEAKPPAVKLFAQHYAETLRRYVAPQTEPEEEDYENTA